MNTGLRFWCVLLLVVLLPLKAALAAGMACHWHAAEAAQTQAYPCHAMAPQTAMPAESAHDAAQMVILAGDAAGDSDASSALACAAACSAPPLPGVAVGEPAGPPSGRDWRERPVMPPGSVDPCGLEKPPRSS